MTRERRLGRGLEALLGGITRVNPPTVDSASGGAVTGNSGTIGIPGEPSIGRIQPLGSNGASARSSAEAMPFSEPRQTVVRDDALPEPTQSHAESLRRVAIDRIAHNPSQPRKVFDPQELAELAESIKAHGLLQPIVVRCVGDGYELVAGERRLRAAKELQWTEVPVIVVDADTRNSAEMAIVENLHRKDLDPLEKAQSFRDYLDRYECTQEELAQRLKIDRSTIANLIRLLELPDEVQQALRAGKITQGHARALLPLGDEEEQIVFCRRIQNEALSVRATEALVQQRIEALDAESLGVIDRSGRRAPINPRPHNEQLAALEQRFRAALGMKVQLSGNNRGRGKLVIHFRNFEEFERLEEIICGPEAARRTG